MHTKWSETYYMKTKTKEDVLAAFKSFMSEYSAFLPKNAAGLPHIELFKSDNGREYDNVDLDEFLEELCTQHGYTVPYSPPLNAHAERLWGLLLRPVKTMLADFLTNSGKTP